MKRMATLHKCQAIAYFVQMAAFVAKDKNVCPEGRLFVHCCSIWSLSETKIDKANNV